MIASAVLIGVILSQKLATYRRVDPELIGDLVIWLVIGAIPAARIYYVLFEWQNYAQHPQDIIAIWQGGIAIHGAIIGGAIAGLIFAKTHRQSFWQLTDIIAPSLILGQAIGRWGNFLIQRLLVLLPICHGSYIFHPITVLYSILILIIFTQLFLYESIWNILVFMLLISLFFWGIKHSNKLKVGTISFVYLIAYSCGRVWIEGFRTDSLMFGYLRVAQLVSLGAIAFGIFGLIWLYGLKKSLPDVYKPTDI